jgi:hypothetical protein
LSYPFLLVFIHVSIFHKNDQLCYLVVNL